MNIIPAIIGKNIEEIKQKVEAVQDYVKWVQIDMMDGVFVPTKSWPFSAGDISEIKEIDKIRKDELKVEFHLMVKDPEDIVRKLIEYGADRIIVHFESTNDIFRITKELFYEEVECVLSLMAETPVSVLEKYLGEFDGVQLMSIKEIGSYGKGFDDSVYNKIKDIKNNFPGVKISVDGGVSAENIKKLAESGVESFAIGSAIFGEGKLPAEEIKKLRSLIDIV